MEDYIVRASAADGFIRAFAATTSKMVDEARRIHHLSPAATVALGRTLTATAMMSRFSKGEKDTLTLQIRGDGPLGGIVAVGKHGDVRGYVHNPSVETLFYNPGKINLSAAVGKNGYLTIIKDFGLKEPYIGHIRLVSGEIAEDLTHYFAYSEQIPTSVALGVLLNPAHQEELIVTAAGGVIIQLMPQADIRIIEYLENRIAHANAISTMLSYNASPEEILHSFLGDVALTIHQKEPCQYQCNCSKEKMAQNLMTIGEKEVRGILDEMGEAELQCHFCNQFYQFGHQELLEILKCIESTKKPEDSIE